MEVGQKVTVTGKMRRDVTMAGEVRWLRVDLPSPIECIYLGTKSRAVGRIVYGGGSDEPSEMKRTGFVRLHYVQRVVASGQYRLPMYCAEDQIVTGAE